MSNEFFEIDSLLTCGVVKIHKEIPNTFDFNCLIPNEIKEDETSDYICRILDSIKDQVRERKSWRFKEVTNKRRSYNKNKRYNKKIGSSVMREKLNDAFKNKSS